MYLLTFSTVRRPSITPSWTTPRSCSSSTRSAASFATSAPLSTEMPTSAACSAEASLMPSPRKPTTLPVLLRPSRMRSFCCGVTRQKRLTDARRALRASWLISDSSLPVSTPFTGTPSASQMWRVIRSLSPVRIFTSTPARASAWMAAAASGFGGSTNTAKPAKVSAASSPTTASSCLRSTARLATPRTRYPCSPSRSNCLISVARMASSSTCRIRLEPTYSAESRMMSSGAPLTISSRVAPSSTNTDTRRRSKSNGTSSTLCQAAISNRPWVRIASSSGLLMPLSKALLR